MTHSRLLTVEDVFDIRGLGLVVVPGPPIETFPSPREFAALLKYRDGHERTETLSLMNEFLTPPPKVRRYAAVFKELSKQDVPIGTEVWMATES